MTGAVLVVGGYGAVGRTVCRTLAATTDRPVLAAGRTKSTAEAFAATVDGVDARAVDVTEPAADGALAGVDTVAMCLDQDDPDFAAACLRRGVDYVDVSPSDRLLRRIEAYDDDAQDSGATGVLSVGLSPGVTNLFARGSLDELDAVERVDITLLLGIGDEFGPDTVEWLRDDAGGRYTVRRNGDDVPVRGFTDPRAVDVPGWGRRRCYRMDLADQHVLARTTDAPTVETRFCYDSRLVTAELVAAARLGLLGPAVDALGPSRVVGLVDALPFGREESVVLTEVTGRQDGERVRLDRWVRGPDQARATGLAAATAVRLLDSGTHPPGVHHSHELFDVEPFVDALDDAGYTVGEARSTNPR